MIRVLGQKYGGGTTLADLFLDLIASYDSADQFFSGHAAKLIETGGTG